MTMVDERRGVASLRLIEILLISAAVFVRASSEKTGESTASSAAFPSQEFHYSCNIFNISTKVQW